ncbi:MAG: cytochrome-c peroxidase, partial [Acinetobacter guillouiae]
MKNNHLVTLLLKGISNTKYKKFKESSIKTLMRLSSIQCINHLKAVFWVLLLQIFIYSSIVNASSKKTQELRHQYSLQQEKWPEAETTHKIRVDYLSPLRKGNVNSALSLLGEKLFFDPQLSRNGTVSCSSCHESRLCFQDSRPKAIGINGKIGLRNTLSIIGVEHWNSFFWDGRAKNAIQQALMPISNPLEMDLELEIALSRVNNDKTYQAFIRKVFNKNDITLTEMAFAIVEFEKTFPAPNTLYQQFITQVQENPKQAVGMLNDEQLSGLHIFRTKAKCMTCHNGALLSDSNFHITGLHAYGRVMQDLGRYDFTKKPSDIGKFRPPSL